MRFLSSILLLLVTAVSFAQSTVDTPVNQLDDLGKRHGMWWANVACTDGGRGCHEFGKYDHGRKEGVWYKLTAENEMIAEETFHNSTLNGLAKYYDAGYLVAEGYYRGLNPDNLYDTIVVTDPETGKEYLKAVSSERGSVKHGVWKFYDEETGRLIRQEEYQVDVLLYRKEMQMSPEDSIANAKRTAALPHNKDKNYTPPPSKIFNYLDFK